MTADPEGGVINNQAAESYEDVAQNGDSTRTEGPELTEVEKCWSILEKNPHEFSTWEYLLKLVETPIVRGTSKPSVDDIFNLKKAYDAMLEKYPLCFGYWKKYADHINTIDGHVKAAAIYESGIKAISNSTYLWEHYLQFKIDTCDDQEAIRSLFEHACDCVGYDFINGHTLWDKYIEYETSKDNHAKVISLFDRVITIPLHQYARFFERYAAYSVTRQVEDLVPRDVLEKIENDVKMQNSQGAADSQVQKSADEITAEVRKAIYNMKSEIYMKTQAAVHRRWPYESEIKRTYFHVNALDDAQLAAWRKYLDFEESEGDPHRIKVLYDRCLVVCALYEEFWIRHAKYLMKTNNMAGAELTIKKACDVFIQPSRPLIRLFYAMFEEYTRNIDNSRKIYETLAGKMPNHAEVVIAYAYFEKRQGNTQKAQEILSEAVKSADPKFKGFFEIQKEKFSYTIHKDMRVLLGSYKGICERNPECKYCHLMYFACALNFPTDTFNVVKTAWELIQKNTSLNQQSKKDFAIRYRDFLVENGGSVNDIMNAELATPGSALLHDTDPPTKKRSADDSSSLRSSKMQRGFTPAPTQQQQPQQPPQYAQGSVQAYNTYATGYAPVHTNAYNAFYGQQSQPAPASSSSAGYATQPVAQTPAAQSSGSWSGY